MKLWNARSVTYKTHLFSALCRSLFTNCCWIFGTSLLVKLVGSNGYSQLYFFASLCSLLYYIHFAVRGQKDEQAYNVYRFVLIIALIASVGCFLEPFWAPLQPLNVPLLYIFVIAVMTVDLVGTTLGPIVLQSSVNPSIFRSVYQRIVTAEVISRIAAASLVWMLSVSHNLNWLYPFVWAMLLVHFVLFGLTVWRMRVSELKNRPTQTEQLKMLDNIGSSLTFMLKNPLVKIAMTIMVWSTVTKFVLEFLFYQVANDTFGSARQIASFVSTTTMTMYVLSLLIHHFISRHLNSRLQLSELLTIQPINILILGGLALVLPPFWPVVLLMVTYNIVHRSIQLPMSRQCLVPVPRTQRGTILSLISIVVAVATMITSGLMTILKNALHLQDFLVLLLVLGAGIFFVITSLDSYYIRNLWSFFREARSGNWQDEQQSEHLSQAELESDVTVDDAVGSSATIDIRSNPILESYAFSFDADELYAVSQRHRQLLQSPKSTDAVRGLNICFVAGFPWFRQSVQEAAERDDAQVSQCAKRILEVEDWITEQMQGYSSVFRRKIKAVAMSLLENELDSEYLAQLKAIAEAPNHDVAESLVTVLADTKFNELRRLLLSCITGEESMLDLAPLIAHMQMRDYAGAQVYRQLLDHFHSFKGSAELRSAIEANLGVLKSVGSPLGTEQGEALQRFMHTLFMEEFRLSPRESNEVLIQSIDEFQTISADESAILVDMHLSFLKRSELFASWQAVMA